MLVKTSFRTRVSREAKQTNSLREELRAQVPFNPHPSQAVETQRETTDLCEVALLSLRH